jgi:hypothetical protein
LQVLLDLLVRRRYIGTDGDAELDRHRPGPCTSSPEGKLNLSIFQVLVLATS